MARLVCVAIGMAVPAFAVDLEKSPKVKLAVRKGLDWIQRNQWRQGYWEANQSRYRVAMTRRAYPQA